MCAAGALAQFPVMAHEVFEIAHVPFDRVACPSAFKTGRDRVFALASAVRVFPTKALLFDRCAFWFWTHVTFWIGRAVAFTERVTTSSKRHSFFIVHRHTRECFTDVSGGRQRIRVAIWPLWINVNQTHLHGTQNADQVTRIRITFVIQPFGFWTPIDVFFRLPDIGTATGKTKGFKAHGFQRNITR